MSGHKALKGFLWFLIAAVLILSLALYFWNTVILKSMERKVVKTAGEYCEVIEAKSICGKLNGNGNGMNFMVALLVRAGDGSEEDIGKAVSALAEKYDDVEKYVTSGNKVVSKNLEHGELTFDTVLWQDERYAVIVVYQSHIKGSNPIDIRGH